MIIMTQYPAPETYNLGESVVFRTPVYDPFGEALRGFIYRVPSWLGIRPMLKRWADRHIIDWNTVVYKVTRVSRATEPGTNDEIWEEVRA